VSEQQDDSRHEGDPPSLAAALTSEGLAGRDAEFETAADRALQQRPYLSIRTRLSLAFAMFFALSLGITIWAIKVLAEVHDKILFLEVAEDYEVEIQQARRFEKNFLLYGTNLEDAVRHTETARRLTSTHAEQARRVVGEETLGRMNEHLDDYLKLLGYLAQGEASKYETELREHGARMVTLAHSLVSKERNLVHSLLTLARRVPIIFLIMLGVLMAIVINFIAVQIIRTLSRLMAHMERIAAGDLSPIMPSRRFRDEFSTLAVMVNRMVRELDRHHRILLESHKLRAMGTLVAGVAHELNNPLNNILLTAFMLQEDYESLDETQRREMVADVIEQSERSRRIIANLLDFARESEKTVQALDLRTILEDTVRLVGNHIKIKKIRLTLALQEHLPIIHGDRQLLTQVFMNLLLNAVDVLPEKGEIRVSTDTTRRAGYLAVDISDNGPGMPRHVMSKIFDPFFTTKPRGDGTGLGLSVSRGIVRQLDGYLTVTSQVGVGTTFTVLLPTAAVPSDLQSLRGGIDAADTRGPESADRTG
jgi:signal transduction histidine kinase